jgi:NAD(P)-dependent dehydrogenase (short-subunit alcohol dehydrogenase family)
MLKPGRVRGKRALVTGGASGIGAAVVALLREEGARVITADIREPLGGPDPGWRSHDVTDEESWANLGEVVRKQLGGLDILVNSAGINGAAFKVPQDPESIGIEQFRRVMGVNAEGTLLGCRFAIGAMKESGGAIVNIGSLASRLALPGMADYGASKAVIAYLTRAVAMDCLRKSYPIRCNLVTPGAIYTPLWDTFFGDADNRAKMEEEVRECIPMKEWGRPEDVAYAVLYLASDEARHVTGADILVDGGQYLAGQATRGR